MVQYPEIRMVTLANGIPLLKGAGALGDNPHVWVSISRAITEVHHLGEALEAFDPAHTPVVSPQQSEYAGKLEAFASEDERCLGAFQGKEHRNIS